MSLSLLWEQLTCSLYFCWLLVSRYVWQVYAVSGQAPKNLADLSGEELDFSDAISYFSLPCLGRSETREISGEDKSKMIAVIVCALGGGGWNYTSSEEGKSLPKSS